MQGENTHCCIPFCERRAAKTFREFICDRHWRGASPKLRREYNRLAKCYKQTPDSSEVEKRRLAFLCDILWKRIKSQAFDTALFDG